MQGAVHLRLTETAAQPLHFGGRALPCPPRCQLACVSSAGLAQPCLRAQHRERWLAAGLKVQRPTNSRRLCVSAAGGPPPVNVTKTKFYESYRRPMNAIYNTVIQELLVQQHIIRYNNKYQYDEVFGLGFVSVFDQILEGVPTDREAIFSAYIRALDEDPQQYRADASKLEEWASKISDPAELQPASDSDDPIRKRLSEIAQAAKDGKFLYTRFFAIGLFRLLELSKAKDPQALQSLVKSMNISNDSVNRDLMTYKGVLSKLSAAKELMQEYIARERKKQQEREEAKKEANKPKAEEPAAEPKGEPAKV